MSAIALIQEARANGLELRPNGDKLRLRGPAEVVERWKPMLAEHKPEIMLALKSSEWLLLHFVDDEPREVRTSPSAAHTEILERHPEAVAAEPFGPETPEPASDLSNETTYERDEEPQARYWDFELGEFRKPPTPRQSNVRAEAEQEILRSLALT